MSNLEKKFEIALKALYAVFNANLSAFHAEHSRLQAVAFKAILELITHAGAQDSVYAVNMIDSGLCLVVGKKGYIAEAAKRLSGAFPYD